MASSGSRSLSQKRYLMRMFARQQAASLSLSEVPVLATFQREDGLMVVVDADGRWHNLDTADTEGLIPVATTASTVIPAYALPTGVDPSTVPDEEARDALLTVKGQFKEVRQLAARQARVGLACLALLDRIGDGPEWREELGQIEG